MVLAKQVRFATFQTFLKTSVFSTLRANLTGMQQKYLQYHPVKLINMNILQVKKYYKKKSK